MTTYQQHQQPRVLINGFGRMGRLFLRAVYDQHLTGGPTTHPFTVVHVNEVKGTAVTAAHLLMYDSVKGIWRGHTSDPTTPTPDGNAPGGFIVDGQTIGFSNSATIDAIPWSSLGGPIDLVVECTGKFLTKDVLDRYFAHGVKKVVVSAPCKFEGALNVVVGVNDHLYDRDVHSIVTAASCTTNCLAPVIKVIRDKYTIVHASFTTIHCVTNTQTIVDTAHADLRRARACMTSLVPTTTGSASAISLIFPDLHGKISGTAVRVPLLNASITDVVLELRDDVTAAEINDAMREAANGELKGVLAVEEKPLVGEDFRGHTASSIVDALSTTVTDRRMVKILAWYDNEQGYCWRMAELAAKVAASI
ncbi:glyceraldehyde-3-phosphate dehydrogenase, type I [Blastocladiella britannica]|nr:glyceraldehyde-3-phosphate dehydrogenase, type I [Blastocladiella britannica]